jgi:putative heme degradation protein
MASNSSVALQPDPAAVLTKAVMRAAQRMGLRQRDLAEVMGASEASVSRLRQGRLIDPASKEGELALLLLRAFRSLDALVGGDVVALQAWLHAENSHIGAVPAVRMRTVEGLVDVVRYLDAVRGTL